ncbi:DUF2339 domain-containing protein [Sporosarcina jiandibaonis]|uniref:DUF2339 domain-containing protein n=1 Tax=Sporosarcina jiandibaonis TaxID=2715535 RepID=UPI001554E4F9|nr:DUF2339 domain-containing protein [Sporosarcina jiandibaonis]
MSENHQDILKRLEHLEREMKLLKEQQAQLIGKTAPVMKEIKPFRPLVTPDKQSATAVITKPARKEFDFEKALSQWLPRVFMFILLLGVLWGLKVGMDNGFITNPVRIVMGYVGTGLLYYFGMKYYGKKNKVFGLTLLGGFIALGILTTFAAHHLYGYFSFIVAFIIGVAYIAAGLWLSEKTKSETLTIFSAIAGFLLPFLLEGESATSIQFCAYILILFLSLFYVSLRQKHKISFYISFLLFHLTLVTYGVLSGEVGDEPIIVGTVLIQHVLLLAFYLKGKIERHVFTESLIYSNFVFALGWIKVLEHNPEILVYGLFAALYVTLSVFSFSKKDDLLLGVFSAVGVLAVSAFILAFNIETGVMRVILLLVNGAVGLWVGFRYKTKRTIATSSFIYVIAGSAVFLATGIYEFISLENLSWIVLILTLVFIYYTAYQFLPKNLKVELRQIDQSLIVGQIILLVYLLKLTTVVLSDFKIGFATNEHIHLLVMIIAIGSMMQFSKWARGKYLAYSAVILYLFLGLITMGVRLATYIEFEHYLFNLSVEILYLIGLTFLFITIMKDKFMITLAKFKVKLPILAIIMQVVYFIFLNKWFLTFTQTYEWDTEYILLAHTFLLFAFAFASVSIGRKLGWKYVKFIGAGLIVLCVLKLFIIDLGAVSILIRAILFTIVGVVGLLYSKSLFKE